MTFSSEPIPHESGLLPYRTPPQSNDWWPVVRLVLLVSLLSSSLELPFAFQTVMPSSQWFTAFMQVANFRAPTSHPIFLIMLATLAQMFANVWVVVAAGCCLARMNGSRRATVSALWMRAAVHFIYWGVRIADYLSIARMHAVLLSSILSAIDGALLPIVIALILSQKPVRMLLQTSPSEP